MGRQISADATRLADPGLYANEAELRAVMARLRDREPVALAAPEGFRPFFVVSRHEDVRNVERQGALFTAGPRSTLMTIEQEEANLAQFGRTNGISALVMLDGDHHRKLRAITENYFLPKNINRLKAMIGDVADDFVSRMIERGDRCDFAADVAFWYPLRVVMTMMGIDPEDEAYLLSLTQQLFGGTDAEYLREGKSLAEHLVAVVQDYMGFFHRITEDRRANPTDDLSSIVANATVDGEDLDPMDRLSYYMILATAGHDTTSASIAGGLLALIDNPDQLAKLRADEQALRGFSAEAVRWTAPVKHFMRTVQADCTLAGQQLMEGDSLLLSYASACRDARAFPEPDSFRIDRPVNNHLAFGYGPHQCLGQYLARMEIEAFHQAFWRRIAWVERDGEPEYVAASFVSGLKRLPIRFGVA